MEVEFRNKELKWLYEGRRVRSKGFSSNKALTRNFIRTVDKLIAAPDLNALKQVRSLNLEKLTDHPHGYASVRVDRKYRLIVELVSENNAHVTLIGIEKLTNHYQ